MKNYYPNQLIQRPADKALPQRDLRAGDRVTLHTMAGDAITSIVRVAVSLFGCTTYTSEARSAAKNGDETLMRFRFRLQDVHHVELN